ncbi:hypothetical protein BX666DRAFT_1918928 [Dichotomocladium elegans]|nr:hypothetical protein BX666DRAFT_1918928 [Dichotomocladium elegans]
MTVKSPFYNKPSTATSVDSCHKCPLEFNKPQDSSVVPTYFSANQVQSSPSAGFEQAQATETPSNNSSAQSAVVEPSSSSAAKSDIGSASATSCSNCGTTTTPLWRRSPQGETICNACGLYLKARNTTRPPWLKRNCTKRPAPSAPIALAPAPPVASACISPISPAPFAQQHQQQQQHQLQPAATVGLNEGEDRASLSCANCNTTTTPLWRRDGQGNTICNACGLYYKLHNVHRPMTMKRSIIKRRKRVTASSLAAHHHYSSSEDGSSSSDDSNSSNGRKRKLSDLNSHVDESHGQRKRVEVPVTTKYAMRPLLPLQPERLDPVEPDAFQKHLPSPPLKPLARLLDPDSRSLPSLPSMPSPPLTAQEMFKEQGISSSSSSSSSSASSVMAAAAALATVSALLNPTHRTHQMLEAHRHELRREVSNLTSLLSRTTAMLQNLDQVMAATGKNDAKSPGPAGVAALANISHQPHVANALMSLFALAAKENTSNAPTADAPATPPYSN